MKEFLTCYVFEIITVRVNDTVYMCLIIFFFLNQRKLNVFVRFILPKPINNISDGVAEFNNSRSCIQFVWRRGATSSLVSDWWVSYVCRTFLIYNSVCLSVYKYGICEISCSPVSSQTRKYHNNNKISLCMCGTRVCASCCSTHWRESSERAQAGSWYTFIQ